MKKQLLFIVLCIIALSCTKTECEDPERRDQTTADKNFLEVLEIGDKMYYSLLIGENYYDQTQETYFYTGDTLELEVTDISEEGVVITQRITPGSNLLASDTAHYYYNPDSVFTNTWRIVADSLIIDSGSPFSQTHLLSVFRLKLDNFDVPHTELTGWRTTYAYAESNALLYTTDYMLFGHDYDTLSVYIHNQPMSYDGNGSTVVYSKTAGIVRSGTYGWWTQSGYGWDRIY